MLRIGAVVGFVLSVAGCEADERCQGHYEEIELTTPLAGGETPQSLMMALGGELVGTIEWHDGGDALEVHPAPGKTGLKVTLTHDGGAVTQIRYDTQGVAPNERLACPDRLAITAKMTLKSDDGALLGSWDVGLKHEVGGGMIAELHPLEFTADNDGDFSATLVQPNAWEEDSYHLTWEGTLDDAGASGYIYAAARSFDPIIGEHTVAVASWTVARP